MRWHHHHSWSRSVKHIWTTPEPPKRPDPRDKRTSERHAVTLPARLTWKDQHGATRFASVVMRNVSEHGVYVECRSSVSIPLYRLLQVPPQARAKGAGDAP